MSRPDITIMAVSNVYSRVMHFSKAGDIELGHYHTYDHGTLLSSGVLKLEILNDDGTVKEEKVYTAPKMILIKKEFKHRLTALKDDTVAVCIHALRDVEGELLPVDALEEVTEYQPEEDKKALIERRNTRSVKGTLQREKDIVIGNFISEKPVL
ncbi:MAG: hypothetical protein EBU90_09840 [Proteobacteria bacterium]|nr:hypothetical protein [Pseudomonadota bacterium]NBP14553.1 hypothetical protein [bacterium]